MTGIVNTLSSEATAQCDGRTASSVDLAPVAFAGYAHFTALQVREGKVRGLISIFSACARPPLLCSDAHWRMRMSENTFAQH